MRIQRLWSKKMLHILTAYAENPTLHLFGITGDIDNLGIFVATNGRPMAENLVDIYNRVIGYYMLQFVRNNRATIPSFCMIPSGEEIFALGVSTSKTSANKFFSDLRKEMNPFIHSNALIFHEMVTISFGCRVLNKPLRRRKIQEFIELVRKKDNMAASRLYLEILLAIREELARDLDNQKFKSLMLRQSGSAILFRNVVYLRLHEYKEGTRKTLERIGARLRKNPQLLREFRRHGFNRKYGLNANERATLQSILKNIEKRKSQ